MAGGAWGAAIVTTFVVQGFVIATIVQHNKKLRPVLLKPYNKMIFPLRDGAFLRMRFSNIGGVVPAGPMLRPWAPFLSGMGS